MIDAPAAQPVRSSSLDPVIAGFLAFGLPAEAYRRVWARARLVPGPGPPGDSAEAGRRG